MKYSISNEFMKVDIYKTGAEVCSIKTEEKEYIWQGDPAYWDAHGPLLFPIVGRTKDNQLNIGGKDCTLPTHGFLSQMEFEVREHEQDYIVLEATWNEETLEQYPFEFQVVATYSIHEKLFKGQYEIKNLSNGVMPYGFGLHNGFNCLDANGEDISDVYLDFKKEITIEKPSRTEDNFMDFRTRIPVIENESILNLDEAWYPTQAPIIDKVEFNEFDLCHKTKGKILEYKFSEGFDLFNAWRMPNSSFICLEPWTSQCGIYPCAKTLEEVENTKYLQIGEEKEYYFTVELCEVK